MYVCMHIYIYIYTCTWARWKPRVDDPRGMHWVDDAGDTHFSSIECSAMFCRACWDYLPCHRLTRFVHLHADLFTDLHVTLATCQTSVYKANVSLSDTRRPVVVSYSFTSACIRMLILSARTRQCVRGTTVRAYDDRRHLETRPSLTKRTYALSSQSTTTLPYVWTRRQKNRRQPSSNLRLARPKAKGEGVRTHRAWIWWHHNLEGFPTPQLLIFMEPKVYFSLLCH